MPVHAIKATDDLLMKATWSQVVLVLGTMVLFFGTIIALTKFGVDATQIMTTSVLLLISILGVLGWRTQNVINTKIDAVKEVSNGHFTQAQEQNQKLQEQNQKLQDQVTALAMRITPPGSS